MSAIAEHKMNEMVFAAVQNTIDDDMNMWHHDVMNMFVSTPDELIKRYRDIQRRQIHLDLLRHGERQTCEQKPKP